MGYQEIGVLRQRRRHECELPGSNGLAHLNPDGSAAWIEEGQVVRCEQCGRAWICGGLHPRMWRRARWWTLRRLARG